MKIARPDLTERGEGQYPPSTLPYWEDFKYSHNNGTTLSNHLSCAPLQALVLDVASMARPYAFPFSVSRRSLEPGFVHS